MANNKSRQMKGAKGHITGLSIYPTLLNVLHVCSYYVLCYISEYYGSDPWRNPAASKATMVNVQSYYGHG